MKRSTRNIVLSILVSAAAALLLTLPSAFGDEKAKKTDGKALFEQKCLKCHKLAKFREQNNDRKGWELILNRMQRGMCDISDEDIDVLAVYLAKQYGE